MKPPDLCRFFGCSTLGRVLEDDVSEDILQALLLLINIKFFQRPQQSSKFVSKTKTHHHPLDVRFNIFGAKTVETTELREDGRPGIMTSSICETCLDDSLLVATT
jgi:hypothetical protein